MKKSILSFIIIGALLSSCGGDATKEESDSTPPETTSEAEEPETSEPEVTEEEEPVDVDVTLEISSNDQMQFDKTELTVQAGQKVKVVLTHTGNLDKTAMGHNFVLLAQGTNIDNFASIALQAKDNDYVPDEESVLASTSLIGGGESTSVVFDAPEAGTYDFICSFPGHYSMMKGTLTVE